VGTDELKRWGAFPAASDGFSARFANPSFLLLPEVLVLHATTLLDAIVHGIQESKKPRCVGEHEALQFFIARYQQASVLRHHDQAFTFAAGAIIYCFSVWRHWTGHTAFASGRTDSTCAFPGPRSFMWLTSGEADGKVWSES